MAFFFIFFLRAASSSELEAEDDEESSPEDASDSASYLDSSFIVLRHLSYRLRHIWSLEPVENERQQMVKEGGKRESRRPSLLELLLLGLHFGLRLRELLLLALLGLLCRDDGRRGLFAAVATLLFAAIFAFAVAAAAGGRLFVFLVLPTSVVVFSLVKLCFGMSSLTVYLQGVPQSVTILTPHFSLAWVDRSGSYFRGS